MGIGDTMLGENMILGSPNKAVPTPMKGGVKRKGTRFWEKKNETKILY